MSDPTFQERREADKKAWTGRDVLSAYIHPVEFSAELETDQMNEVSVGETFVLNILPPPQRVSVTGQLTEIKEAEGGYTGIFTPDEPMSVAIQKFKEMGIEVTEDHLHNLVLNFPESGLPR